MSENAYWTETKKKFTEENLNEFKTWESVLYVPIYSFFQFEEQYGRDVMAKLASLNEEDAALWKKVLKEPFLGHTTESYEKITRYLVNENERIETSPWALKSAHHILSYITNTGRNILDYDQIVEFGPGIGETCRIINDLGFKGDYYLYDLPEVLRVSSYYNSRFSNVKGVTHYSEIPTNKKTLFIGTWSISETPLQFRDEVFTYFKDADYLLIYQMQVFEYSNNPYFMIKFPQLINKDVNIVSIPWLSHIANGNNYLFV